MELKVWVDGVQRIVCGVTEVTTCQEVVIALAQAIGPAFTVVGPEEPKGLLNSVQSLICVRLCDPLSITNSQSLPKPMSIESVTPSISSSVVPFASSSFPTSGSFQMSQLFASGGQSTGVSASTSVLPLNTQD